MRLRSADRTHSATDASTTPSSLRPSVKLKASARIAAATTPAQKVITPPTPDSLPPPQRTRRRVVPIVELPATPTRKRVVGRVALHDQASKGKDAVDTVIARNENGRVEGVGKIHLIQEKVRHDPWKMLVACSLLNKTAGRAAIPVFWAILERWSDPQALSQASIPDLTGLLYPLGLFNQRAASLIRMSTQYLSFGWPRSAQSFPSSPPSSASSSSSRTTVSPEIATDKLDVHVFYGAGMYASDSFRIYSDLLPGGGGPQHERKWLGKRRRAIERMRKGVKTEANEGEDDAAAGVEEVGEWLSDDEEEVGEDEWRTVRPGDKELRRYLVWRWGLEGIVYDILTGPKIVKDRDRRRLQGLLGS